MYTFNTSGLTATKFIPIPVGAGITAEFDYPAFVAATDEYDVAFLGKDGALVATPLTAGTEFQIVQKLPNNELTQSAWFTFGEAKTVEACDLIAGVGKEMTVTFNSGATAAGQQFSIRIFDTTEGARPYAVDQYSFTSITGSETATDIADGIVADYTAKEARKAKYKVGVDSRFTLTAAAGVVTIVAKDKYTLFDVVASQDAYGITTVATSTDYVLGEGEGYLLKNVQLERETEEGSRLGNTNRFDNWNTLANPFKEDCTYDSIKLFMKNFDQGETHVGHLHLTPQVVFYVESSTPGTSGSAAYTALKTAFGL